MAGSSEQEVNPVEMNVVPMVDVIFCLCVFFMCSFHFKELEGRFATWLPKDKGAGPITVDPAAEMRVALFWNDVERATVREYGRRLVHSDEELASLLVGAHQDCIRTGQRDVPVIVDAEARVPWDQVMNVVNLSKRVGIGKFEFARGSETFAEAR